MKIKRSELTTIVNEEHISVLKEEKARLTLLREYDKLLESGLTKAQANKQILRLDEGFFDAILEQIREWLFDKILQAVGVDTTKPLARAIREAFGNMGWEDWKGVFSGDCNTISTVVVEAIEQTVFEVLVTDTIGELLGYDPEKLGNTIGFEPTGIVGELILKAVGPAQETIVGTVREYLSSMASDMMKPLHEPLTKWICDIEFNQIIDHLRT